VIFVVFDTPKIAVFAGTVAGDQLVAVFQSVVAGAANQVASWG
jgi:hypothetical protein